MVLLCALKDRYPIHLHLGIQSKWIHISISYTLFIFDYFIRILVSFKQHCLAVSVCVCVYVCLRFPIEYI